MKRIVLAAAVAALSFAASASDGELVPANWKTRGFCVGAPATADVPRFCAFVTNTLAPAGVNTIVFQIGYCYRFRKHRMCTGKDELTQADVDAVRAACASCGIRLVPKMNLLGHQQESPLEWGLFTGYPGLEELREDCTRRFDYAHSICPRHPEAKRIVCDLVDEIVEAFGADTMHIGCDEVFEIGVCPRCKGTPTARLYADWVNGLARHLREKGVKTMIWSDRLLDSAATGYSAWEASDNGTDKALPLLDKDILLCDWHYETQTNGYPSVDVFAKAGRRMLVCPWRVPENTRAFVEYAKARDRGHVEGVLFTTWIGAKDTMDALEGVVAADGKGFLSECKAQLLRSFRTVFPAAKAEWLWYSGSELPLEGNYPGGATRYDRLPKEGFEEIPPAVQRLSTDTAGMLYRFRTDSDRLRIFWKPRHAELAMYHMPATGASGVGVYQWTARDGWQFVRPPYCPPKAEGAAYTWTVEPNAPTMVYLPLYNGIADIKFGVKPGTSIERLPPRASGVVKPVVFYGTSTTQGACVSHPGIDWVSVAMRIADAPAVNLGFSGSGKMEDALLDRVARLDASLYVVDAAGNMSMDEIDVRYERFLRELRRRRPTTPILVPRHDWIRKPDYLAKIDKVEAICARLKREDPKLWADLTFFGHNEARVSPDNEGTVDQSHLTDLGSMRFGTVMGEEISSLLTVAE